MGFIYKLTLKKETRKAYIGQTIRDIHKRLEEHQLESSNCRAILAAIQKHGWDNFDKEWYEVPDEDLNFYEEMLVALYGTLSPGGYNLKEGGGATGKPSEETKRKMSEAQAGKTLSDEHKQKMSEAQSGEKNHNYGKTPSDETKKKISKALSGENAYWYGKTHTEEAKQQMSKAKIGEKNRASKRVFQYTIDGTYVDSFASSGEAARALEKTDGSKIRMCARGKRPSAYGFKWTSCEKLYTSQ
ncbi:GIY-YIG catalytic domain-containing endonuclease [Paramecium bursaria Chlorella virus CVG-1]|nr:GIY-YIG catalytic domain-containing endonuclease [Paramecium bursaria Chlorella virus CVG-1]